ncbi:MAG: DUF2007 domain-containing protein [Pseudomonadota bacterium]
MTADMVIVYRAANPQEDHIVAGMLQAEGIEAHASGTLLQGGVGELAATDFALVRVPERDAVAAKALVQDYDSGAVAAAWDASGDAVDVDERVLASRSPWSQVLVCLAVVALVLLVVLSWV